MAKAVLPEEHYMARQIERLAEANQSAQTRVRLKQREEIVQVS